MYIYRKKERERQREGEIKQLKTKKRAKTLKIINDQSP